MAAQRTEVAAVENGSTGRTYDVPSSKRDFLRIGIAELISLGAIIVLVAGIYYKISETNTRAAENSEVIKIHESRMTTSEQMAIGLREDVQELKRSNERIYGVLLDIKQNTQDN